MYAWGAAGRYSGVTSYVARAPLDSQFYGYPNKLVTVGYRKGPLSQRSAIAKVAIAIVMYKLLDPSIRVRTAPPVSVRVRTRVSDSFSFTVLHVSLGLLQ